MIQLGLIGLGTVGSGVVRILQQNASLITERLGFPLHLRRIAVQDLKRRRGVSTDPALMTSDAFEVIRDPQIQIVIELIGGYEPARSYILEALGQGKHVVTANKALLAEYGAEIFTTAARHGVQICFEASVCGGIPIIRSLRQGFAADQIRAIYGIVNGTGNFILSRMADEGKDFGEALAEAQRRGYAETNPTLDIEGVDSAHKIAILAHLAYGGQIPFKRVYTEGISRITPVDIDAAKELGFAIKLLAMAKRSEQGLDIRVHPTMLSLENVLSQVGGVRNAICVRGDLAGLNIFIGQGAGALPTGSAVVADVMEICHQLSHSRPEAVPPPATQPGGEIPVQDIQAIRCPYYLRCTALDSPGVLAKVAGALGRCGISISSVIQKGRERQAKVPVIIMTHEAQERQMQQALAEIRGLEEVGDTLLLRVEEGV